MANERPAETPKRKTKARSPSYPGIPLGLAIQRAQRMYDMDGQNLAPVDSIVDHWGYTKGSGPGLVTVAALKKYGLLEDQGVGEGRRARLTDLALTILLEDPSSETRREAVKEAALNPTINREIWEAKDGRVPSPTTLKAHLIRDRKFTPRGAQEFSEVFRETLDFAGLEDDGSMSPDDGDKGSATGQRVESPTIMQPGTVIQPKGQQVQTVSVTIPVPEGAWPVLNAPLPMLDEDWKAMLAYLELMRPAFVRKTQPEPESEKDQG